MLRLFGFMGHRLVMDSNKKPHDPEKNRIAGHAWDHPNWMIRFFLLRAYSSVFAAPPQE